MAKLASTQDDDEKDSLLGDIFSPLKKDPVLDKVSTSKNEPSVVNSSRNTLTPSYVDKVPQTVVTRLLSQLGADCQVIENVFANLRHVGVETPQGMTMKDLS